MKPSYVKALTPAQKHAARIKAYRDKRKAKGLCEACGQKKPAKAVKK